jgi:hypothetical protein
MPKSSTIAIQVPDQPALHFKSRGYVGKYIVRNGLMRLAMEEIERQLKATTGEWKKNDRNEWELVGEKPDGRARAWAVDRILQLANAYPSKRDNRQAGDWAEQAITRRKVQKLITEHANEPVAVLKFYYDTNRWPSEEERKQLLTQPVEHIDNSPTSKDKSASTSDKKDYVKFLRKDYVKY